MEILLPLLKEDGRKTIDEIIAEDNKVLDYIYEFKEFELLEVKRFAFVSGVIIIFIICTLFVVPMLRLIYV